MCEIWRYDSNEVISEPLFKDTSEKLSNAAGKAVGDSEHEGEAKEEVTENGEISSLFTS